VASGKARGIVIGTGLNTEIGKKVIKIHHLLHSVYLIVYL
jgi:magnesium-transporting ATPase (P-type)